MNMVIPLFPCRRYVFPGSLYEIEMSGELALNTIERSLKTDSLLGIGIVPVNSLEMMGIGCLTKILSVKKSQSNSGYDILIKGIIRFQLLELDILQDNTISASVNTFEDIVKDADPELLASVITLYKKYLKLQGNRVSSFYFEECRNCKPQSFRISEMANLLAQENYLMLLSQSENGRLELLKRHFEVSNRYLSEFPKLGKIDPASILLN